MRRYPGLIFTLVACLLLSVPCVQAQNRKTAKEAEKLSQAGATAKQEIQVAADKLKQMLDQYNAIMEGSVDRKSAHKALTREVKDAGKLIENARASVDAMNQQADRLFSVWQADIDKMSDANLKQKNQGRLDARKERYATLDENLALAHEELTPFVTNLNDQIAFLGQDLSDDAVLDLQDEAKELNELAGTLAESIGAHLGMAKPSPPEEAAEVEADAEAEEDTEAEADTDDDGAEGDG